MPLVKSHFSKVAGFYRSSHLSCSVKNGVHRKVFPKFTGKHLCWRLLIKGCKKETLTQVFFCEFCKISKNIFFYRAPADDHFCFLLFPATLLNLALPTVLWKPQMNTFYLEILLALEVLFRYIISFSAA